MQPVKFTYPSPPRRRGIGTSSHTMWLGSPTVFAINTTPIRAAVFAKHFRVTDRLTDTTLQHHRSQQASLFTPCIQCGLKLYENKNYTYSFNNANINNISPVRWYTTVTRSPQTSENAPQQTVTHAIYKCCYTSIPA